MSRPRLPFPLLFTCSTVLLLSPALWAGAVIIDHTATDLSRIPAEWLAAARSLALHYAHTSHGSQILTGMEALQRADPELRFEVQWGEAPAPPPGGDALFIYDGNDFGGDTYIMPEMYWADSDGLRHTAGVVEPGYFGYSMWSWCGQQSENDADTVQRYLDALDQLEREHPGTRFIYMTGHTDGSGAGGTLNRNNEMVRQFARANGKILYDFADIESHDPAGNAYPDTDDSCPWCRDWCRDHPEDCSDLPTTDDECAHSHGFNCVLKARAFWWMMARLAGWDGG